MNGESCYKYLIVNLDQVSDDTIFHIYPNPAKAYVNIVAEKYPITLIISDVQGNVIR